MPKTITQLPAAASASHEAVIAADNPAGTLTEKVTLGQVAALAKSPQLNPPGMARMVSVASVGTLTLYAKSTTGYVAALWWDGSVQVFGNGVAANEIVLSKSLPTTGNWSKSAPKEIFIWSCTNANAGRSGDLTELACPNSDIASLDVSGLTAMTAISCNGNSLTSLDVSGLTALTTLTCDNNSLTSLNVSGSTALTAISCSNNSLTSLNVSGLPELAELYCDNNSLASLNVSGLPELAMLYCNSNSLTSLDASGSTALTQLSCYNNSLTSLDVSGLTALTALSCDSNALTSLDVSDLTALTRLSCSNNSLTSLDVSGLTALGILNCVYNLLTSLRAVGCVLQGSGSYWMGEAYGGDVRSNQLNAAALNQFYNDLAPNYGYLNVDGNPGTTGDDPTIATAKNYTVFGT